MGDRKNIISWPRAKHPAELFRQTSETFSLHLTTTMEGRRGRVNPYRQNIASANFKKHVRELSIALGGKIQAFIIKDTWRLSKIPMKRRKHFSRTIKIILIYSFNEKGLGKAHQLSFMRGKWARISCSRAFATGQIWVCVDAASTPHCSGIPVCGD